MHGASHRAGPDYQDACEKADYQLKNAAGTADRMDIETLADPAVVDLFFFFFSGSLEAGDGRAWL